MNGRNSGMVQMANDACVLGGGQNGAHGVVRQEESVPNTGAIDAQCRAPGLTTGAPRRWYSRDATVWG
jgi:hypothetical protein